MLRAKDALVYLVVALVVAILLGCQSSGPPAGGQTLSPAATAARGEYLVELLGCAGCHSDGVLAGRPVPGRHLAGSSTGIAWSLPGDDRRPGVVYPPNLTPDPTTGLGGVGVNDIVARLRGQAGHTYSDLPVMPWPAYLKLSDHDAQSIALYLLSLEPVVHQVPPAVAPGQRAEAPYVHFGVLQWNAEQHGYDRVR